MSAPSAKSKLPASQPEIFFVTPSLPLPPRNGGEAVTAGVLEMLMEIAPVRVYALAPEEAEGSAQRLSKMKSLYGHVQLFPFERRRSVLNLLKSYAGGLPISVYRNACPALQTKLRADLSNEPNALVISDHWLCAPAVLGAACRPGHKTILHAHNAEHVLWQRHQTRSPLHKAAVRMEARRAKTYEQKLIERFNRVVTLSNLDRERLARITHELAEQRIKPIPPCVESPRCEPNWNDRQPNLLFVGTLSWPPNAQGLMQFVERVWPTFKKQFPEATLTVVGKGLPATKEKVLAETPGVTVKGFVEDLGDVYRTARLFLAPIVGGSGVKIKTLHSLARGVPVFTTPDGAEGIDVGPPYLHVYRSADDFTTQAAALWENETRWQQAASGSQSAVTAIYGRDTLVWQWRELLAELSEGKISADTSRRHAA